MKNAPSDASNHVGSKTSIVRTPSQVVMAAVLENAATARHAITDHHTPTRPRFPSSYAIAIIGTAALGPKNTTRNGIKMVELPVPMMPANVPANRPTSITINQVIRRDL